MIDAFTTFKNASQIPRIAQKNALLPTVLLPASVTTTPVAPVIPTTTTVVTKKQNSIQLKTSKGLYITKNGISKRLNYFYEGGHENTELLKIDDD